MRERSQHSAPPRSEGGETGLRAQAWVLGSRLDLHGLPAGSLVGLGPHIYALGPGRFLAAFRYGVAVFFGTSEGEQAERLAELSPHVSEPLSEPERDELEIRVDPNAREGVDARGVLLLRDLSVERLQVVAHVLAKSTVLAHHEERIAEGFSRVEARAEELVRGFGHRGSRQLLREIGGALAVRAQTIGRIEMTEKPEIVWDDRELDRLYELLAVEFELRERDAALSNKLHLISESASTSLDLIHTRRSLRVEWYIVILIAVEIVLIVYDIARG